MSSKREKLDPTSRLNYAKVYTIEYNVKVLFIGGVDPKQRHQVLADLENTVNMPFYDESIEEGRSR